MTMKNELNILFSKAEIAAAVSRLASEITKDYHNRHLVLIGILKGSFMFMADLIRLLDCTLTVEFISTSSYGGDTQTSGKLKVLQGLRSSIKGKDALVIEDIVDTGHTTSFLLDYLKKKGPASLRLCSLLDKPSRRQTPVTIDYLGLTVPNKFVVGYGLDYDEKFRNLPDIYVMGVNE
ncbi:hypoxanthine phosphoribosyltransferase [Chloroflexota bacterium]